MRTPKRVTLIVQSPADKNEKTKLPYAVAWAAARGIARDTHHVAILVGEYGTARFDQFGGGTVEWNEKSTKPGEITKFGERTTVSI